MFYYKQRGEEHSPQIVVDAFHASTIQQNVTRLIDDASSQQAETQILQDQLFQIVRENQLRVRKSILNTASDSLLSSCNLQL